MGWIFGSKKKKRDELNDEIKKLQEDKQKLLNDIAATESKIKLIDDDLRIHKNEIEKFEKKNVEAENEVRELKLSVISLQNQKSLLLAEIKKLQADKKEVLPSIKEFERLSCELIILKEQKERLNLDVLDLNKEYEKLQSEYSEIRNNFDILKERFINHYKSFVTWKNIDNPARLTHSFSDKITVKHLSVQANVTSENSNNEYTTTLTSCTCPDFKFNTNGDPCKHMYALAMRIGILGCDCDIDDMRETISEYAKKKSELAEEKEGISKILNTRSQRNPWLANQIALFYSERENQIARMLEEKHPPAIKAAEQIKKISAEKRDIEKDRRMLKSQLDYLFYSFPWLEEYITTPPKIQDELFSDEEDIYAPEKSYLSVDEYNRLSVSEKNQLALDRWNKRNKTAWEIGIEYERYVGYTYEQKGYSVEYRGAIDGLEDMGRDVIARKDKEICIIQCKRWNHHKTVHEKHIFQLYGSSVLYELEHPSYKIRPIFVTSTELSECAKKVADFLHIEIIENFKMGDRPQIKCNISKNGEKIYHLPFDQQYDHVVISSNKGEFYAWNIAEAENLGFNRAKKWLGDEKKPSRGTRRNPPV